MCACVFECVYVLCTGTVNHYKSTHPREAPKGESHLHATEEGHGPEKDQLPVPENPQQLDEWPNEVDPQLSLT